jgi:hypothetical protein
LNCIVAAESVKGDVETLGRSLAASSPTCYKACIAGPEREKIMEQNSPPPLDPTKVTPQAPEGASTQITSQPKDDPRWMAPKPPPEVGGSSAIPVMTVGTIALVGTCLLGALLGSWVVVVAGLILGLLAFHYFAWGWLATRLVAEQQKQELLKLAEQDAKRLPDPQRSRHI